jgi:hypothetical protein
MPVNERARRPIILFDSNLAITLRLLRPLNHGMRQDTHHYIERVGLADEAASSMHSIQIGKAVPACICRAIALPSKVTIHGAFSIQK